MNRATQVLGQGRWHDNPADTVVLDFDDRHRRRIMMTGTRGLAFLLDLETAVALRGGDALVLDDGRLIEIVAAPEALIEIRGTDPQHLVRIGWHLGNRHLPTQITARGLRIRRDHVIEDMLRGLGVRLIEIEAPFDPEGGAYTEAAPAQDHGHGHAHNHAHHGHDHHDHVQSQGQGQDEGHVHDEHCGQDHKHDHKHDHAHAHPHDHGH